jgi:hypothetical protein
MDVASHYNISPVWLQAMIICEGGKDAFIRAVQCSTTLGIDTYEQALHIGARSLTHAMSDFIFQNRPPAMDWAIASKDFVPQFAAFLAAKWAPYPAKNDPKGLNKNWPGNFIKSVYTILNSK